MHPNLLHLGHLTLPTFGVLAALGLMAALALSERTAPRAGLSADKLWDAGLFAILAAFVASRLLLAIAYWQSFKAFPMLLLTVPSLTASGLLAAAVATALWLLWKRIPLLRALDAWAPCATLVWCFLALGHYAEGSDPGLAARPVALYTAAVALLLTVVGHRYPAQASPGHTAGLALTATGLAQFLLSFLRVPGPEAPLGLDPLQWLAAAMIVAGTGLYLVGRHNTN